MNVGTKKYYLDVPNGWTTENKKYGGIDYFFLSAPKTKEDPNTNINIVTESMQNLDITTYREKAIESVLNAIPTAKLIDTGSIQTNTLKGVWYSYNMKPNGIDAFIKSYIFQTDGIAYILTSGTQPKDKIKYEPVFEKVVKSFQFTN